MGQRQLAAIMFTDFVGYTALTQRNETLALALLEKHWELLRPVIAKFDGREIKTTGDGLLIEFPSTLQAVEAGLAMQVTLDDYNGTVDQEHAIQIRIGIHTGDIERRGDDVFGDGVNIAARLEPLAAPGGICISDPVYTSVHNKIDVPFYSMGGQRLKNISQSIVAYSNHLENNPKINKTSLTEELSRRNVFKVGVAYAIVAWLIIQVASITFPALQLPQWAITLVTVLIIIGFPLALLLAWAFDLTPEGVQRTDQVDQTAPIASTSGHKFDFIIIGLLAVAIIFLLLDNYIWVEEEFPPIATMTTETKIVERAEPTVFADRKSVAVLPFSNRSDEKNDAYFTDGLHDDLITHLSKITDMKVISRTSVMQYRDTQKNMKTIGAELGVATLLEGSVQRAGDQVRINIQLIDADTDEHLWAESYDRELTAVNIFAIQSEIAAAIASALRATLSPEERERLAEVPTENLAAYDNYLKGRYEQQKLTREGFSNAIQFYKTAIEIDQNFAEAHERLGWVYLYMGTGYGWIPPAEAFSKAKKYAIKALELKPTMGRAHELLASIRFWLGWDVAGAEPVFKRAIELSPNDPSVYTGYAYFLSSQKRHVEAIAAVETAIRLNPNNKAIYTNAAWRFMDAWDFDRAIKMSEKAYAIDPLYKEAQRLLGWGFAHVGDYESALKWFTVYGGNADIAYINGLMGRHDVAMTEIRRRQELAKTEYVNPESFALLYVSLGNFDQAFEWLAKGINERQRGLLFLDVRKRWEKLREDPRFEVLIAKIKTISLEDREQ